MCHDQFHRSRGWATESKSLDELLEEEPDDELPSFLSEEEPDEEVELVSGYED